MSAACRPDPRVPGLKQSLGLLCNGPQGNWFLRIVSSFDFLLTQWNPMGEDSPMLVQWNTVGWTHPQLNPALSPPTFPPPLRMSQIICQTLSLSPSAISPCQVGETFFPLTEREQRGCVLCPRSHNGKGGAEI